MILEIGTIPITTISKGDKGDPGAAGQSAYEAWLDLGNEGTEQDFIDSLKGADGEQGPAGQDGTEGNPDFITTTFAGSLLFDDNRDYGQVLIANTGTITANATGAKVGKVALIRVVGNGVDSAPTITGATQIVGSTTTFDNTNNTENTYLFSYTGGRIVYDIIDQRTVTIADVTAPTFSNVSVDQIAQTTARFNAQINEAGTIYWALYANNASAPTKVQIAAGTGALSHGSIPTAGSTIEHASLSELTVNTPYDIYYYGADDESTPNETSVQSVVEFTTAAASQLSAPGSFTASAAGQTQINLTWTDVSNESSYLIEVSDNGTSGWSTLTTKAAGSTSHSHTGLTSNTTKYYRITAVGDGVNYTNSNYSTANATTSANAAPSISSVTISGTPQVGQVITGSYSGYSDAESDSQDTTATGSEFNLKTYADATAADADTTNSAGTSVASGYTGGNSIPQLSYTVQAGDVGKVLKLWVRPKATTGTITGAWVGSAASSIVGAGDLTFLTENLIGISQSNHVFSATTDNAYNNTGVAEESILWNSAGTYEISIPNTTDSKNIMFGFRTSKGTNGNYTLWSWGVWLKTDMTLTRCDSGGSSQVLNTPTTCVAGSKLQLRKSVSNVCTLWYAIDGVNFTQIHTYPNSISTNSTVYFYIIVGTTANKLYNPKYYPL